VTRRESSHEKKKAVLLIFPSERYADALTAYGDALNALMYNGDSSILYPQLEAIAVACYSNRAQCHMFLDQPAASVVECDAGLALPGVARKQTLFVKLYVRKVIALSALRDDAGAKLTAQGAEHLGLSHKAFTTLLGPRFAPNGQPVAARIPGLIQGLITSIIRKTLGVVFA
jgi:hypothetical protein